MTTIRKALFVTVLVCFCTEAYAEPSPKDKARSLFLEANELFDRGMFQDALTLYRKARALYPSFKIDLNIGGTLDALGRRTEAAVYFERFLLNAAKAPKGVAREARRRLKSLRRKLGWVKVTCMVEGAVIRVDGVSVGRTPRDLPIYVTPGRHRITLEREGYSPKSRRLTIGAGKRRSMDFLLDPVVKAGDGLTGPGPDAALAKRRSRKTIWALTTLGAGVALTAGAAVLYGVGLSRGNDSYESYLKADTLAEADARYADVDSAKTMVIVGHALMGAALVAYGFSFYSFVTRPCVRDDAPPDDTKPEVTVAPTSGGAYLSIGGRF